MAAKALLPDYKKDEELTSFTALDSEDFHAQGLDLAYQFGSSSGC